MSRLTTAILAGGTLLVLAGCGSGSSSSPTPSSSATSSSAEESASAAAASSAATYTDESDTGAATPEPPFTTEIPASAMDGLTYPDGLQVTITSVKIDPTGGNSSVEGEAEVRLTQHLINTGSQPFYFAEYPSSFFNQTMTYGENRYKATAYLLTDNTGADDVLPQRLMPGTAVDVDALFGVPGDQVTDLRFTTSPNSQFYPDIVFSGVEELAR